MPFRHYSALAFNVRSPFELADFRAHVAQLADAGCVEVELAGRVLAHASQRDRMQHAVEAIHDAGLRAVLYTSAFGSETRSRFAQWAQRDARGQALGYLKSTRALMMCPRSPYVQVAADETAQAVNRYGFDAIFVDIPWIMRGGCFCPCCKPDRDAGATRDTLIRLGLDAYCTQIRALVGPRPIGVNVGAPPIHNEGPHPSSLVDVVDEVVTEWNPYRWGGSPRSVTRCLTTTAAAVGNGVRMVHATTCTHRNGQLIHSDRLEALFHAIVHEGALPRIGLGRRALPPVLDVLKGMV